MTNSPNHAPSQPETAIVSGEVRDLYDIDAINEWRSNEAVRLSELRRNSSNDLGGQYVTDFLSGVEDELDSFLASKGINSGCSEYSELRQLYRDSSIDRVDDDIWGNSPASRGVDRNDIKSQSDKVKDYLLQWHNDNPAAPDPTAPLEPGGPQGGEDERTADVIEAELDDARKEWANMQAKRQGRLWDRRIPGYNAAKERYERLKREMGITSLEVTLSDDSLSDDEKNAAVISYIFDENNKIRTLTSEEVEGTRINKFVKAVGGWLNRGNGWVRLGKGVAVGVGVGAVGAGVGLLAGAAGAGAAVAGGAALIAKVPLKFTKAYAQSDARQGRGMHQLEDDVKSEWSSEINDTNGQSVIDQVMSMSNRSFESDTKREQGKRRKTTAVAMGGIALGSLSAVGVASLLDYTGVSAKVKDSVWGGKAADRPDGSKDKGSGSSAIDRRIDDAVKKSEEEIRKEYDQKLKDMQKKIDELSKERDGPSSLEVDSSGVFEFGYSTAPENLLEEIVKKEFGVSLSGSESYKLINYLMTETDGNIFDGVRTEWHTPGKDVWIMDSGGQTSGLSDEALRLIDSKLGVEADIDGPGHDTSSDYGSTGSDEAPANGLASTGVSIEDETAAHVLAEANQEVSSNNDSTDLENVELDSRSDADRVEAVDSAAELFEFSYNTEPSSLIREIVYGDMGIYLDNQDASSLVSYLAEQTGGKVFDGVELADNGRGGIRIVGAGGQTSGFTAHARALSSDWLANHNSLLSVVS